MAIFHYMEKDAHQSSFFRRQKMNHTLPSAINCLLEIAALSILVSQVWC